MPLETLHRATGYVGMARDIARARRSTSEQVRKKAERHLVQRMGKLRGLPQKLGQMMSFSESEESGEAENPYRDLQEEAEPLPLSDVAPVLERAWGRSIDEVLSTINPIGKAGSIGQVHQATLRDGRQVAVKVQYPGIGQAVQTDLKMLGWLSRPLGSLRRGFHMDGYRQAICDDLALELDYRQEAKSHEYLQHVYRNAAVAVPGVVKHLSTEQVLVTDWLDGDHWSDVQRVWSSEEKRNLARLLLSSFLEGLFVGGAMQADWHPGNFRFRRDGGNVEIVSYDLGSIYRPSDNNRLTLARLIQATRHGSESPLPLFLTLGFSHEYLEPMAAKLPALCRVLFEPFCVERPYHLADWNLKERVADILGEDRWNFRIAGPPHMVFLMRAFHGLTYYIERLDANVLWSREFDRIARQLMPQMQSIDLLSPETEAPGFASLAKHLKIRVTYNGKPKATITTNSSSIENLQELLDEDLKERIISQGIDLRELVSQARRRCYAPGKVFELQEDRKNIVVSLE